MDKIINVLPKDLINIVLEYSHHKKNKYDGIVEEINICIRIFKFSWSYPKEGLYPTKPEHYDVYKKPSDFNCSRCNLFRDDDDCRDGIFNSHFHYKPKKPYCNCHGIKINMNSVIHQLKILNYEKNKELLLEYDSDLLEYDSD